MASRLPHVVFYNLTNSGASAIVPILEELLTSEVGYCSIGDPSTSSTFENVFRDTKPSFHWTHSPPSTFSNFLGRDDFRFICLIRDPRDVLVSHIKDLIYRDLHEGKSESNLYLEYIGANFDGMYHYADEWIQLDKTNVMAIRFDELKADIPFTIRRVLDFLDLDICDQKLKACCEKYSFESITNRNRGETGPVIRNNLMFRKGISGDWKNQFDSKVTSDFESKFQPILNKWGYGSNPSQKEFQIVSAPMPCGVGWLVNVLLELGIRTTHQPIKNQHQQWMETSSGQTIIHPDAENHLRWHLPAFRPNAAFNFEPNINIRWEHRLDFARDPRPTILFTRDGRDAVYSQYKRHYESQIDFMDYLGKPDQWPDHLPEMFDLPPAESWALFNFFWLEMKEIMPVKIIRFEDTKTNPNEIIRDVLEFLGISRTDSEIETAIQDSSFTQARNQEKTAVRASGEQHRNNHRKGMAYEWKTHFHQEHLDAFIGMPDEILQRLGYDPVQKNLPSTQTSQIPFVESNHKYRKQIAEGDWTGAKEELLNAIRTGQCVSDRLNYCAEFVALHWKQLIFKNDLNRSLAASKIQSSFAQLLSRYSTSSNVRDLYSRNIQLGPTILPLGKHRGYILIQFDRVFIALSPALGPKFDIAKQTPDSLIQLAEKGLCIVTSKLNRLTPAIDQLIDTVLSNAQSQLIKGDFQQGSAILQNCIELTGGQDSKTLKIAVKHKKTSVFV